MTNFACGLFRQPLKYAIFKGFPQRRKKYSIHISLKFEKNHRKRELETVPNIEIELGSENKNIKECSTLTIDDVEHWRCEGLKQKKGKMVGKN